MIFELNILYLQIQMTFPQFHLDKPNECDINYLQVYDKDLTSINNPTLNNNFCGSIADLVTSKGNEAYLRFFVTKAAINSTFEAVMTAIRTKEKKDDGKFKCFQNFFFIFIFFSGRYLRYKYSRGKLIKHVPCTVYYLLK